MLPDYVRARARNYLDWIGPAISRHESFKEFSFEDYTPIPHPSLWKVRAISNTSFSKKQDELAEQDQESDRLEVDENLLEELKHRFQYRYPYEQSTKKKSKTSVSEMKRIEQLQQNEEEEIPYAHLLKRGTSFVKRPMFKQEKQLSATEVGTVVHTVMQHVPQEGFMNGEEVEKFLWQLVVKQLITEEEMKVVEIEKIIQFFSTPIGRRFKNAKRLFREVPFTLSITDSEGDAQIVQGIIDCLMEDEEGKWVLVDYKTDQILPAFQEEEALLQEMTKRYGVQIRIYSEAIEMILRVKVDEKVLYLFNAGKEIQMEPSR